MRNFRYFLAYVTRHKAIVHQLDFIGVFSQEKVKNILFVKLDSRYTDYFSEYSKYSGRAFEIIEVHLCQD